MSTEKWKRRKLIRESLRGDAFREWQSGGCAARFQTRLRSFYDAAVLSSLGFVGFKPTNPSLLSAGVFATA